MAKECKDDSGNNKLLCESCYLKKDTSKLSGKIANCKGGKSFNVGSFNPTCDWTNKNCKEDYCENLDDPGKTICKDIFNQALNSKRDLESVMNRLENGVSNDKDKVKVYKNTLKKVLCDIGVSSGSKRTRDDRKSVYSEYYWYFQNTWDDRSSANQLMTVIAYVIIFTMIINSIRSFVLRPIMKVKGRTDVPSFTKYYPILILSVIIISAIIALITLGARVWAKMKTVSKKENVDERKNKSLPFNLLGYKGDIGLFRETDSYKFKPISTVISWTLIIMILLTLIFSIVLKFLRLTDFKSMLLFPLVVVPYFVLTTFTYSYAPKVMLFYTLCLIFVNFCIISIMRLGKKSYLYSMILFNFVIIIFSWWIYGTAANIGTVKTDEKMGSNGYLFWIAIYVTLFSLIKIGIFSSGILNIPIISSLSSAFLEDTRSTRLNNSVDKLVNNYYGFLNEDLILETMDYIYKVMGLK